MTSTTADSSATAPRRAVLWRMVMPTHTCPYGLKSKSLLERRGYEVEDHHLTTRDAQDAFKARHQVRTTPQTFIDGQRIGGYDDLRRHLGLAVRDPKETSYRPVIAVFGVAALLACAISWVTLGTLAPAALLRWFVGVSMCLLAMLKLQDVETFSTMFLNYDLLGRRWVPYSYVYPWAELLAGVTMVAGVLPWLSVPLATVIGTIGVVSVVKAVYVDKREIKCACVGGSSPVPLGAVSLTENVMMAAMAVWMLV